MKKQKNATRIIAIVLVVLMALALIPIAASAEDPDDARGRCARRHGGSLRMGGGKTRSPRNR